MKLLIIIVFSSLKVDEIIYNNQYTYLCVVRVNIPTIVLFILCDLHFYDNNNK